MSDNAKERDQLSAAVIGAAMEVHKRIGPGLLESIYSSCLAHELHLRGMSFRLESELPVQYKGVKIAANLRADMIVENELILELKSIAKVEPVHKAQLLSYLRMSGLARGLLINFNVAVLRDGIFRVANNYRP
ncbi:MAG: GxxExxY protein [bacterium]